MNRCFHFASMLLDRPSLTQFLTLDRCIVTPLTTIDDSNIKERLCGRSTKVCDQETPRKPNSRFSGSVKSFIPGRSDGRECSPSF